MAAAADPGGFVGVVGMREVFDLVLLEACSMGAYRGTSKERTLYRFASTGGYLVTWLASSTNALEVGFGYMLAGSVKQHRVLPTGFPETVLTRCKIHGVLGPRFRRFNEKPPRLCIPPTSVPSLSKRPTASPVLSSTLPKQTHSTMSVTLPLPVEITNLCDVRNSGCFNVLVVLLQIGQQSEFKGKSGISGKLATVIVGDPTNVQFTITLWQDKLSWLRQLQVGDILILQGLKGREFRSSMSAATTAASSYRVVGHYPQCEPGMLVEFPGVVALLSWARDAHHEDLTHGLGAVVAASEAPIIASLNAVQEGMQCSVVVRVTGQSPSPQADGTCYVSLNDGSQRAARLVCPFPAPDYFHALSGEIGAVWELQNIRGKVIDGALCLLYPTPQFAWRRIPDGDGRATAIIAATARVIIQHVDSVAALVSKGSGVFTVNANIVRLSFPVLNGEVVRDGNVKRLVELFCSHCWKVVIPDSNNIALCVACFRSGKDAEVEWGFHPFQVVVSDGPGMAGGPLLSVTVTSALASQIFPFTSARVLSTRDDTHQANTKWENGEFVSLCADLCSRSNSKFNFQVRMVVDADDNDVVASRQVTLIEFSPF